MSKRRQTLSEDLEKDPKASKMVLEPVKLVSWEGESLNRLIACSVYLFALNRCARLHGRVLRMGSLL
jgi:hypothetical protein